jgi:hypothetical protein
VAGSSTSPETGKQRARHPIVCRGITTDISYTGHSREAPLTALPHIARSRQDLGFHGGRVLHAAFVIETWNLPRLPE